VVAFRSNFPSLLYSIPAHHDDNVGGDVRRNSSGSRSRRRVGNPTTPRGRDHRRINRVAVTHALYHAGDLSLPRPVAAAQSGLSPNRRTKSGIAAYEAKNANNVLVLITIAKRHFRPTASL